MCVLRVGLEEGGDQRAVWSRLRLGASGVSVVLAVLIGRGEHTRAKHLEVPEGILAISGIKNVIVQSGSVASSYRFPPFVC